MRRIVKRKYVQAYRESLLAMCFWMMLLLPPLIAPDIHAFRWRVDNAKTLRELKRIESKMDDFIYEYTPKEV